MSRNKTPALLKEGDCVGIISPAGKIDREIVEKAAGLLSNQGFKVLIGKNACNEYHTFSGTDAERAADFQQMLDDPNIKAIFCSRGGYGSIRTIVKLNFSAFLKNPKWIVGYSDITVFHSFINSHFGIKTIHGTMPVKYYKKGEVNSSFYKLIAIIKGEKPKYQIPGSYLNKDGNVTGTLIGGNLSVLLSVLDTRFSPEIDGKILFIEEVGEYLYRIDRMLSTLKLSGRLKKLKGLVVGGITGIPDDSTPYGKTAEEIISEYVAEYNFPVSFNLSSGHTDENLPLILGNKVRLEVDKNHAELSFQ